MQITVINVVFPKGDEDKYTLSYTATTDLASMNGRVLLTTDEFNAIENGAAGYPTAVLTKLKEVINNG